MKEMEQMILHPIRIRIIQLLAYNKSMTVAALAEEMYDIPRSTIYRHVHLLYNHQILMVVKEQKIRGTYEREYALKDDNAYAPAGQEGKLVSGLLLQLFSDFSNYFKDSNAKPMEDKLFLSTNALLLSDDEFDHFKAEIYGVIKKNMNLQPSAGRKMRTISIVSSPCQMVGTTKEDEKGEST